MSFTIQRTDHTGITVSDLQRSLAFWRDVLGFEVSHSGRISGEFAAQVVGVPGAEAEMATVIAPGHRIELLQYHAPDDRQHLRPRSCDVGSVHIGFQVDDLDAALAAVADAGWKAVGEPQAKPYAPRAGTRFAYLRDPDGSTIELIQPPAE